MAKPHIQPNHRVRQIFEDLEAYKEFCVDFGYKFDERTLYDMRVYAYRQHVKHITGKWTKNNWEQDFGLI